MRIVERFNLGGSRVDHEACIIHDVKILGLKSANGRTYKESAVRAAAPLYEGAKSYAEHSRNGRLVKERIGFFKGVEYREGSSPGLFAKEFHYFKTNPLAQLVAEIAERDPKSAGFSHAVHAETNAAGTIIEDISEVESIDFVDKPATTKGIHEGLTMKKLTLSEIVESLDKNDDAFETLSEAAKDHGKLSIEVPEDGDQTHYAMRAIVEELLTAPAKDPNKKPKPIKESTPAVPEAFANLLKDLTEQVADLKQDKQSREVVRLAESLLDKHNIDRQQALVDELVVLQDEKLMEARIDIWPPYIKHAHLRPDSHSVDFEPVTESAENVEDFCKSLGLSIVGEN